MKYSRKELLSAVKSLNKVLAHGLFTKIAHNNVKTKNIANDLENTVLELFEYGQGEEIPGDVIDFYHHYIAVEGSPSDEGDFENLTTDLPPNKPVGKVASYKKRISDKKHLVELKFSFEGFPSDIRAIIKSFGEMTTEYVDDKQCYRFVTPLNLSIKKMAADFKYCYEKFEIWVQRAYGRKEWYELYVQFGRLRINELYECVDKEANISCLYNLPGFLVFDKGTLSGNEFKVLCAFMLRAKREPKLGGIKIAGWGPSGLVREQGFKSRDTVRECIKTLERKMYIKRLPTLCTRTKNTYQVCV